MKTARKPVQTEDFQGYGATPETALKCRHDTVERLWKTHLLDDTQQRAALEIRAVVEALHCCAFRSAGSIEAFNSPPKKQGPPVSVGFLPIHIREAWHKRYEPWKHLEARMPVRGPHTRLECVYGVVVENYRLGETERLYGLPRRSMRAIIEASLDHYAEIAGWIRPVRLAG